MRFPQVAILAFVTLFLATLSVHAVEGEKSVEGEKAVNLKVGDPAPEFSGQTDEDKEWKSADVKGKKHLIVYFYPADMTGGCTAQACAYRDAIAEKGFGDDVEVIGVSGDTVENHKHFKEAHKLNFTLLADPEGKIAQAFGVKSGPGGKFETKIGDSPITLERGVTTSRWTFIIDKDWKIAHVDRQVDAAKDSEKTLKVIEGLSSPQR
jgi:thioredoxin-dependent peroxiredoxin